MNVHPLPRLTPLTKRIVDILSGISYPPREAFWQIEDAYFPPLILGPDGWQSLSEEMYAITMVVRVADVTTGQPTNILVRAFHVYSHITDEQILENAYETIKQFEAHECAEHFTFKGVKIHDPHQPVKPAGTPLFANLDLVRPHANAADRNPQMDQRQEPRRPGRGELEMARARDAAAREESARRLWHWDGPRPHLDKDWGVSSSEATKVVCDLPLRIEGARGRRTDIQAMGRFWNGDIAPSGRKGRIKVENGVYRLKSALDSYRWSNLPRRVA